MKAFFIVILLIGLVGIVCHKLFSTEARIKRLWEEVFRNARVIAKHEQMEKDDGRIFSGTHELKEKNDRVGKLINALLDYKFPQPRSEQDEEFVREHQYEPHFKN